MSVLLEASGDALYVVQAWDDDLQRFVNTFWTDRPGDWLLARPVPFQEAQLALKVAQKHEPGYMRFRLAEAK